MGGLLGYFQNYTFNVATEKQRGATLNVNRK